MAESASGSLYAFWRVKTSVPLPLFPDLVENPLRLFVLADVAVAFLPAFCREVAQLLPLPFLQVVDVELARLDEKGVVIAALDLESFHKPGGFGAARPALLGRKGRVQAQLHGINEALNAGAALVVFLFQGLPLGGLDGVEVGELVLHHAVELEFLLPQLVVVQYALGAL